MRISYKQANEDFKAGEFLLPCLPGRVAQQNERWALAGPSSRGGAHALQACLLGGRTHLAGRLAALQTDLPLFPPSYLPSE